ncbi:flavin-binding monooxygenase-like family protein [Delphinella strobiligena]|nr:flavin-binding monooxygenase-like family protein [Delphinella strobiligena]
MSDTPQDTRNDSALPAKNSAKSAVEKPAEVEKKYAEERDKRLRLDGTSQFIDVSQSTKFHYFQNDPWVDYEALNASELPIKDDIHTKFLVIGAGFSGLLFAVHLIQAGFEARDIRIVDPAGGFGGTWYWNRYPGLMCDVESYIYMPLLEEMNYMPKHKYSYGTELREYAELIAEKYDLKDSAMFRYVIDSLIWDESRYEWAAKMEQYRGPGEQRRSVNVHADFVFWGCGVPNHPQIPGLPGIDEFEGRIFHTSRWNYDYTGGSPENPDLSRLKGKRVGIIGTGATAVQIIPHVAKYADHLYVFQRTPPGVDVRGQQATDAETWKTRVANKSGWQKERREKFNECVANADPRPSIDMVEDGWSKSPSFSAAIGSVGIVSPEAVPDHVAFLHALDFERTERVRARVDEVVEDKSTAERLKAWYPTWCKRACFHDDYLPCFNQKHVTLVDTNGKGVDGLKTGSVIVGDVEYPVDVLIMGTGYRAPLKGSPARRGNMIIKGRKEQCLEEVWLTQGVSTLHGVVARDFPNFLFTAEQVSQHVAYIINQALGRFGTGKSERKVVIEPTQQAQEDWSIQILRRAGALAGAAGCTPSYWNNEGEFDRMSMEEKMKAARGTIWGEGPNSLADVLESWRKQGGLQGLDLTT